jgi:rubredoxin
MNNNPLRQYFRRPAVYIKLPSGGLGYSKDVLEIPESGDFPVYPMTAIDEITARTPDALFNGTAVAELIKSCVPGIKDPWQISSVDLDSILIAIKAASGGENLELDSTCPKCEDMSTYQINLIGILSSLEPGQYDNLLEIGDLKIKFKPLTYKEINDGATAQFEVQRIFMNLENLEDQDERNTVSHQALENITRVTMELISSAIEYIETPGITVSEKEYIFDFLQNCDRNVYLQIREHNTMLKQATEVKPLKMTCSNCEFEYEQAFTLNPADFFE